MNEVEKQPMKLICADNNLNFIKCCPSILPSYNCSLEIVFTTNSNRALNALFRIY